MIAAMTRPALLAALLSTSSLAVGVGCTSRARPLDAPATSSSASAAAEPEPAAEPTPAIAPSRAVATLPTDPFAFVADADGIIPSAHVRLMPAVGDAPLVQLVDPGAEPRSELRYALTKNTKAALLMTMDFHLALRVADRDLPAVALPSMVMLLDVTTTAANADEARVTSKLRQATTEARTESERKVDATLAEKLGRLTGMTTTYTVDRRGFIRDASLVLPPDVPPEMLDTADQMRESFTSFAVPMPIEPVGLGAKWRVLKRMLAGGVDTVQLSTYTMSALDGEDVVLDAEVAQFAVGRGVQNKAIEARLQRYQATGDGTSRVRMSDPMSTNARVSASSSVDMRVANQGQEIAMSVRATMAMTVAPNPKAPTRPKKRR